MSVTLGTYTFPQPLTAVAEALEELGGRDARRIRLQGVLDGFPTREALEAELDALLAAASASDAVPLSLREGRRYFVRRTAFKREIAEDPLTGAYTLQLDALPPYEEAAAETVDSWYFAASGATKALDTPGNIPTPPRIELQAIGTLYDPTFSDGERVITYHGVLADEEVLILDGPAASVTLNGDDVTPYTTGVFPRIVPGGTTLTYTDTAGSSHAGIATLRFRDRWC
jgi:hypothetical protein